MNKPHFFFLSFLLVLVPFWANAQLRIAPSSSVGYINHLTRNGINVELGVDWEIPKIVHISTSYRVARMDNNTLNEVNIDGFTAFFTFPIIDRASHQLSVGPGITSGRYERFTDNVGFEKEYNDLWLNPVRLRYAYLLNSGLKLGLDATVYGDDGDGSFFLGLMIGYYLIK